jgi:hypothetical protein
MNSIRYPFHAILRTRDSPSAMCMDRSPIAKSSQAASLAVLALGICLPNCPQGSRWGPKTGRKPRALQ